MKAVIMAGGEGSRLRPLTSNTPKPLLTIAGRPMMEHVIHLLRRHGITDIVVTVAFMANAIRDYFGDGSEFGVQLTYVDEPSPLGTAGSVRNAAELLKERFIVLSGDVITDIDLSHIIDFHVAREAMATIGLTPVDRPLDFGIVITRDDGSIDRFLEKPTWGQVFSDTINTGIYVLEPEILDLIDPARPVDFSSEVFPQLLAGRPAALRRGRPRVLGGRGHGGRLPPRPQGRARPDGPPGHPRLPGRGRRVGGGGDRDRPGRRDRRPGGDRARLHHRVRHAARRLHRARLPLPGPGQRPHRPLRPPRQRVRGFGQPAPRRRRRQEREPAGQRAGGRGRRDRRRGAGRCQRHPRGRRQGVPVQDHRGRRRRQLLDRVGEPRLVHAVRPRTGWTGWPTSTSRPSWR